MKRTYPANIDGQIFYIDEDAFDLLKNYLEQLHLIFRGNEGQEIVGDIESRIRELFNERIDRGASVIVLADVNNVISTMGRPEDLCENPEQEDGSTTTQPQSNDSTSPIITFNLPGRKRLYRNMRNKVFGGVFGGLATFLGWNANIMRLLYVIAFFTFTPYLMGPLTLLYLLLWMIIPVASTPQQLLEQNGQPVNVDTVGQAVMATAPAASYDGASHDGGFVAKLFTIIGKLIMAFLGLTVAAIAFAGLVVFIATVSGAIAYYFSGSAEILSGLSLEPFEVGWPSVFSAIFFSLSVVALFGLMAWGAFSVVFNFRGVSLPVFWIIVLTSIMLIIAACALALIGFSA